MTELEKELFACRDEEYRAFQSALMPTVDPERMIGVRTPQLRAMAKRLVQEGEAEHFFRDVPHRYFEEDQIHALAIERIKDPGTCMRETETFLPYIDNWATCDQLRPRALEKDLAPLDAAVRRWLSSDHVYTVRFAYKMRMSCFLGEAFDPAQLRETLLPVPDDYYVRMMIAWYLATALAKQWEDTHSFLSEGLLDPWTHNKTIQKAVESLRITQEQKTILRAMRRRA